MLSYIKDLFTDSGKENQENKSPNNHNLQIAACALLLEIGTADDNLSELEKEKIIQLMKAKFELTESEVKNLIASSEAEIEESVSIYEFTDVLNKNLSNDEKYNVIKYLWHIAYADGNVDSYEDFYIKKISNNLHLHHKDRIAAKFEVKEELGIN